MTEVSPISCPGCSGTDLDVQEVDTTFQYGAALDRVDIPVRLKVFRCTECGEDFCDHEAEEAKSEALIGYLQKENRELRKRPPRAVTWIVLAIVLVFDSLILWAVLV